MMPMTIKTGGDFGGHVWFPERHRFAVVSLAVMSETVLMAFAATLITHHFEMTVPGSLNAVSCMAIGTDRPPLIPFQQQLAMNTFVVGFFSFYVAFPTRARDICVIDRRIAIDTSFNVVNAVTVIA